MIYNFFISGIKCDSEHASKIVETYKSQTDSPLLWCILKCIPMYHESTLFEQGNII